MLTAKVTSFVEHYLGDCEGNGAKAAELAGYSKAGAKVRACELLKRDDVRAAIAERAALIRNQPVTLDTGKILDAAARREVLSGIVQRTAIESPDTANRAIETLNKMDGLYVQKHLHAGVVHIVASPSDERL